MRQPTLSRALGLAAIFGSTLAFSHAVLTEPLPRSTLTQKMGPCGVVRTTRPTVLVAGQQLLVKWNETFAHPGYYRISFSAANDTNWVILKDDILNPSGTQPGSFTVTLPSEPCTACTLQLIQVMTESSPPTNYYSCADLVLNAAATPDAGTPPQDGGTPWDAGSGSTVEPASGSTEETSQGSPDAPKTPREAVGGCRSIGGTDPVLALLLLASAVLGRRFGTSRRGQG
jgi:hypothetical protein